MSDLPKGFGLETPPTETKRRCRLGNICEKDDYDSKRCTSHRWTHKHDEAYMALRVLGIIAVVSIGVLAIVEYNWQESVVPARANISGLNCGQLAEYIADRNISFDYAEHRYEWLCVNEQIKEFRG